MVDRYYNQVLPKNPDLLNVYCMVTGLTVITMSVSKNYTCAFFSIKKLMQFQGTNMQMAFYKIINFKSEKGIDQIAQKSMHTNQDRVALRIPFAKQLNTDI